jgi:transcription elongation factor Elf1
MKNKTKITYVHDPSHAKPFNTVIACAKCTSQKAVTVYPALGKNFFECQNCLYINIFDAKEMEVTND